MTSEVFVSTALLACLALSPLAGCGLQEHLDVPEEHPVHRREFPLHLDPAVGFSGRSLPPPLLVPGWCFAAGLGGLYEDVSLSQSDLPFAESPATEVDCRPPYPMLPEHGGGVVGVGDEALRQLLVVSSEFMVPTALLELDEEAREVGVDSRGGYWRLAVRTVRRGFRLGPPEANPKELGRGFWPDASLVDGVGLNSPFGFATELAPGWYAHCVALPWYDEGERVGAECVAGHCWGRVPSRVGHWHIWPEEANDPAELPDPTPYLWVGVGHEHLCIATTTFGDDADFEDLVQGMREQWVEAGPASGG